MSKLPLISPWYIFPVLVEKIAKVLYIEKTNANVLYTQAVKRTFKIYEITFYNTFIIRTKAQRAFDYLWQPFRNLKSFNLGLLKSALHRNIRFFNTEDGVNESLLESVDLLTEQIHHSGLKSRVMVTEILATPIMNFHCFYTLLDCEMFHNLTSKLADDNWEMSAFNVWHNDNGA